MHLYQSSRQFHAFSFLWQILVCEYTISQCGRILISCTISSESLFPPSRPWFFIPSMSISLMWLTLSSVPLHNLQLLFCCMLSIFALIQLVLVALFRGAIKKRVYYYYYYYHYYYAAVYALPLLCAVSAKSSAMFDVLSNCRRSLTTLPINIYAHTSSQYCVDFAIFSTLWTSLLHSWQISLLYRSSL